MILPLAALRSHENVIRYHAQGGNSFCTSTSFAPTPSAFERRAARSDSLRPCSLTLAQLFAPQLFLAIALLDAELKRLVRVAGPAAAVLSTAAVTHQHVPYQQIEQAVESRGAEQDRPRQPFHVQCVRHHRSQTGAGEDGQPERVWKILLLIKLLVAAYQTRGQNTAWFLLGNSQCLFASRTFPFAGTGIRQPR